MKNSTTEEEKESSHTLVRLQSLMVTSFLSDLLTIEKSIRSETKSLEQIIDPSDPLLLSFKLIKLPSRKAFATELKTYQGHLLIAIDLFLSKFTATIKEMSVLMLLDDQEARLKVLYEALLKDQCDSLEDINTHLEAINHTIDGLGFYDKSFYGKQGIDITQYATELNEQGQAFTELMRSQVITLIEFSQKKLILD